MKKELINIKGYGGISLQGIMWLPEETPKALLQVLLDWILKICKQ